MTEFEEAVVLANRVLDKPMIDPDGDIVMLARQFLRAVEGRQIAEGLLRKVGEIASPMVSPVAEPEIDSWRARMATLRELTQHLDRMHRA